MQAPKNTENVKAVCPESTLDSAARRGFIRKAAILGMAAGVGGTLVGKNLIPESSASSALCTVTTPGSNSSGNLAVWNGSAEITQQTRGGISASSCKAILFGENTGAGTGVLGTSKKYGVHGCTGCNLCAIGVYGTSKSVGVYGCSPLGIGVYGTSKEIGVRGCSPGGYGVQGISSCGTGVSGSGKFCGVAGSSPCGIGVHGTSCGNIGVRGSSKNFGVYGCSCGDGVYGSGKTSGVTGIGSNYGVYGCSPGGIGISGSGKTSGVAGSSPCGIGVQGITSCGIMGVLGSSKNIGVSGCSPDGTGVYGSGKINGVYGTGSDYGVYGCSPDAIGVYGTSKLAGVRGCSPCGTGVEGISVHGAGVIGGAFGPCAIPFVAKGYPCSPQNTNLQQWQLGCDTPLTVINKTGWLGIGTSTPQTALQVNGGVSYTIATKTANYTMANTDFAILANASTGVLTITLPSATYAGMVVNIKKIDSSKNAVTVSAGSYKIEGKASESLAKQYDSLTLIADGVGTWYELSSGK